MTTTITLTPTLTLTVADRRIQQSSIDSVWDTITQHIRATGRATQVAVLDGAQLLRMWRIAPDGTRTPVEVDSNTTPADASFRLLLSPWMMSVPHADGPQIHEVSTLSVARAQATQAAQAGDVELILQTAGTDEDEAEVIAPIDDEPITATQPLDDDLFEDLEPEEEFEDTGPDEATRRFRRRMLIGGATLSLFLLGGLGLAGWSMTQSPEATQSEPADAASSSPAPEPSGATESAHAFETEAIAPAGFSGTPAWEVVGATDQSSSMTSTGQHVGAVSGRALDVVNTDDGEVAESVTLPATPQIGPYPLGTDEDGGLLMATDSQLMTWSKDHGLVESKIDKDDRLVQRGTTAFVVPHNDDTRPDALQLVTTDGLREYTSPDGSSAAPIGPARDGGFLWASSDEGGSLVHADSDGEKESTTRLIGPAKGTTISQWIGATEDYAVAIWANDGSGSVLAIHDAETGEVVDTEDLSTGAGSGLRVVPSVDGRHLIAGSTLVDLQDGQITGSVDIGSSSSQSVVAVPGGWIAAKSDGTQFLISSDGESLDSPESTESLLGLTETGNVVADNRGAIAAFTPDTEGDDK